MCHGVITYGADWVTQGDSIGYEWDASYPGLGFALLICGLINICKIGHISIINIATAVSNAHRVCNDHSAGPNDIASLC
jgi:hypothetical protein